MNPVEWYYARDNKQSGPVSAVELKQLATAGNLSPDDLVWREGMAEWAPARNVRGLFDAAPVAAAPKPAETPATPAVAPVAPAEPLPAANIAPSGPMRHPLDAMLDNFRPWFNAGLVDSIGRFFRACGSYGLLAAILLSVLFSILMALNANPAASILSGFIMLVALVSLQFLAGKFCDALDRLNEATPGELPSSVFPDGLSVLSKLLGIVILLTSVIWAVTYSDYAPIAPGAVAFLALAYLSLVAMNPASLNYKIGAECGAAEEALAVFMYLFKALTRFVPVAFGAGVVCGVLLLGISCVMILAGDIETKRNIIEATSSLAFRAMIVSSLLPVIAYLFFLLCYLLHGLCKAILGIPSLDEIKYRFPDDGGNIPTSEQGTEG